MARSHYRPAPRDREHPYTLVVNKMIFEPRLSVRAKMVWLYLRSKIEAPDYWYFTYQQLAEFLADEEHPCTVQSAKNATIELWRSGYLDYEKARSNRKPVWRILWLADDPQLNLSEAEAPKPALLRDLGSHPVLR